MTSTDPPIWPELRIDDHGRAVNSKVIGGRYLVEHLVGRGGNGLVYRAGDAKALRSVAIKVPSAPILDDPVARHAFVNEARYWTRLVHPNIVRAFDVIDDASTDYRPVIVMEFFDQRSPSELEMAARRAGVGLSLVDAVHLMELHRSVHCATPLDRQSSGPLPFERALDVLIQVCRAMDYTHREGLVHLDLAARNIFVGPCGRTWVTDFGLVKAWRMANRVASTQTTPPRTPGSGSLSEEAEDCALVPANEEPAKDVESFGVMAYELLCQTTPLLDPLRQELRSLPKALAETLASCLEHDPRDRPRFNTLGKSLVCIFEETTHTSYQSVVRDRMENHDPATKP